MQCGSCEGGRRLRVVYAPAFGTTLDAGDLVAADARGWSYRPYSGTVDVGDQNGDGVGDVATSRWVYFPDPPREPGSNEPDARGFHFGFDDRVVGSLADVSGDGRREIAVARIAIVDNAGGQNATYAVDIYDSARAPAIDLPGAPLIDPSGDVVVAIDIGSGAGSRGDELPLHPLVELAPPEGPPLRTIDLGTLAGSQRDLRVVIPADGLQRGQAYRVRATATNGRGQRAEGPWRGFVYGERPPAPPAPPGSPPGRPVVATANPTAPLRLIIGRRGLRVRNGLLSVPVSCRAPSGACRGTLRLSYRRRSLGSKRFAIVAGAHRRVNVRLTRAALRRLAGRRSVRITARAQAVAAGGARASASALLAVRLR